MHALLRRLALALLPIRVRAYASPAAGYSGWLEAPIIGCVGFVEADGGRLMLGW